jgi:hypothetical protein
MNSKQMNNKNKKLKRLWSMIGFKKNKIICLHIATVFLIILLLSVHDVNDVMQQEIHTAKPFSTWAMFQVDIGIKKIQML